MLQKDLQANQGKIGGICPWLGAYCADWRVDHCVHIYVCI